MSAAGQLAERARRRWTGPRHRRPGMPEPVAGLLAAAGSAVVVAAVGSAVWSWVVLPLLTR